MHYFNPKGTFILTPHEKCQGPHPKEYPQKLTYKTATHPSTNQVRHCLTRPCQQLLTMNDNQHFFFLITSIHWQQLGVGLDQIFFLLVSYHFFFQIEDPGGLSVTGTVTVSINDINDNQPKFATNSYVTTVDQSANVS